MPVDNVSTAGKPPAKGGKKILGMDRRVAIVGGLALAGGVLFILWRNHQAAQQAASSGSSQDTGAGASSAVPDTSGIQGGGMQGATGTETLVIKIRDMQGHKRRPPVRVEPPPRRPRRRRHRARTPRHIVRGPVPPRARR